MMKPHKQDKRFRPLFALLCTIALALNIFVGSTKADEHVEVLTTEAICNSMGMMLLVKANQVSNEEVGRVFYELVQVGLCFIGSYEVIILNKEYTFTDWEDDVFQVYSIGLSDGRMLLSPFFTWLHISGPTYKPMNYQEAGIKGSNPIV